jgi:ubiquinol-cytochrome c reductase cytochrome c1 subunit
MRTEGARTGFAPRSARALLAAALLTAVACVPQRLPAAESGESAPKFGADWQSWRAQTSVADRASVQRGARNFVSYCLGCHGLKYERWSRLGADLGIPEALLEKDLLPPGRKAADYIETSMPATDAEAWFGKAPPDLSLMVRVHGTDYIYQLLTTFYIDPTRQTGANNLRLPTIAMPDVLSELGGLKMAVYRSVDHPGADGTTTHEQVFDHFEQVAPGRMSLEEYDGFVRDTVNFLDYVSDPSQVERHQLGVWVVLFLLVFTWLAWLVKREYWKDVH